MKPQSHCVRTLSLYSVITPCYATSMKIVTFLSQKGGSGKTTLAVHTAVAAEEDGERVVIIDTDLQKSASTWNTARQKETPAVVSVAAVGLDDVIKAARHDAMTLCIVDTAPHAAPDAARVARAADLVIIPCRPTAFDLAAAAAAVESYRPPQRGPFSCCRLARFVHRRLLRPARS